MKIFLSFDDPFSKAYLEKLQTFSDTILAQGITENRPPLFCFPGNNHKTFCEILDLQDDYDKRHGV